MNPNDFEKYIRLIGEGKTIEAEALRVRSIPNSLIKHISLNDSDSDEKKFNTLKNNELWFSDISKLNDPYEFKGLIVNETAFMDAKYPDTVIMKFTNFLEMKEYGVVCLSAREINYLPMWAYYTNNYKGYCVEYDVTNNPCLHQVMYEPNRIPIASLLIQLTDAIRDAFSQGKTTSPECDRIATIIRQNLYIKSKCWEHEKEYRIALPISNDIGENKKLSDLGLKVKRIIAGINCSEEHLRRLNSISNEIGCGNIFISYLSNKEYGMDIREYK